MTAWPCSAHAAFTFCNRTSQTIQTAFAYRHKGHWQSEGWWIIQSQQCMKIRAEPLTHRFYYYYARSTDHPLRIWSGKYPFCTDTSSFAIEGDGRCTERGHASRNFAQIDIGERRQFTLDFNE
ncbi:MAG: DUF1036 domain-containing protein [Alphaproteobacteria bacterium]